MDETTLRKLLDEYRGLPSETEWLEFKEAKKDFHFDDIGRYFSALSNEANLKGRQEGWLIFGIHDKTREIVGTQYRLERSKLDKLKQEIAMHTSNNITFIEIHELFFSKGRVIMFQIPAAPNGVPVAWKGHYFGRNGESLVPLNIQKIEFIRSQAKNKDWSAEICDGATINDLDSEAIAKARHEYKRKHPKFAEDVDIWDDITFLNKAKVTIQGKITRTAIILLGKPESEHFLSPSIAKMSWILKDENNIEKDYEHFGPPFILNTDRLFKKIRNLKYRYMPDQSLFPIEINQYDSYVIREALHNCIAHQDYELQGRINIIEKPDELIFTNLGDFIPSTVENVIKQDAPQEYYRNRWLAEAMVNLNMIDTIGSGIKKMFIVQRNRYFPLPDYDLNEPNKVKVRIFGKILDENYTKMLINNTDLDLDLVINLDKVQKRQLISREEAKTLRSKKLVEGRYPNLYVSAKIAAITGDKSTYIKNRAFDKEHYKKLIISFLEKYGSASREDIDNLILDKLSDALDEEQKKKKVTNILYEMRKKDNTIINTGSNRKSRWKLTSKKVENS
ncbi:RNA-binding domain-containing protein [Ureibacillus thermosphaericus]|uniref:RNA-binding domain-containing protein n=1 Tax=Ureibacillus thermosphaericus TaxID=51173 RepID=UPI000BBCB0C8|nr:RNA-binding domain-containing protein [Ureibacillus thermosphaericus]